MLFRQPGILYFLIFLVIPIVVHLFKLRKFQKEYFTNVELLKQIQLQTRKSSVLKKWLTLAMRLLALGCIIFAFAQPYFPSAEKSLNESKTFIYLDNSFSMQALGKNGPLLPRAVQDLLSDFPQDIPVTLQTNDQTFQNTSLESIKNELLELTYTNQPFSSKELMLKANQVFSNHSASQNNLLIISDFQNFSPTDFDSINSVGLKIRYAIQQSINQTNVSLDSLRIQNGENENLKIKVWVNANSAVKDVPVSLFLDKVLAGKSSLTIEENKTETTEFTIPKRDIINGFVQIEDNGLFFDNRLYFANDYSKKIKIGVLGDADTYFLKKIYTPDEFDLNFFAPEKADFTDLMAQNLIVLNELIAFTPGLLESLVKFHQNGGSLLVILPENMNINVYNLFFRNLNLSNISKKMETEKRITGINFSHPLFDDVFEKSIQNFDYPKVAAYYPFNSSSSSKILSYENGDAFFANPETNIYLITASLQTANSNFKNSPLIVPSFYKVAQQSFAIQKPYYLLGKANTIDVEQTLDKDEVLSLKNTGSDYIPLQIRLNNKVSLTFDEFPNTAGLYEVFLKDKAIKTLAFNDNRNENIRPLTEIIFQNSSLKSFDSATELLSELKSQGEGKQFWKWFVIFALLFLVAETLILKYIP
ncbi:MAG: BatA domain-containing protein [Flavobacteriaceae bacterium]|nr:BatA domain-containing protein [Flavobacteriaceae bacterium]MDZ4148939.1 BatA domain-containing protein [Flavobacteriaceae bacterium]